MTLQPSLNQLAFEGATTQQLRLLAQKLAAYIPDTLTRKYLQNEPISPGKAEMITAATMFADMSGFTRMAEVLAVDGARGTEMLSRTLLMTFTALVNAIHDAGGEVSHFHGDAMMVYFPDEDGRAASRALAAAQFMQRLMQTSFSQVEAAPSEEKSSSFVLSVKIGVSYGRCLRMVVGDEEHLEFVLAGAAVDEAVAIQVQAKAGQVVGSKAVLTAAALPATEPFRVVHELPPVPAAQERLHWEAYDQPALVRLLEAAPPFIPASITERLQEKSSQSISDHRSVTSMFVQFEGIDFDSDAAGDELQTYYLWAWQTVRRYGGLNSRVNRVLTGDKGNQLHILFGAPVAPDAPEQALRCALQLQQKRPGFITAQRIGLTTGRVFAGAVGSLNRREYTVVGRRVNLSARLTQICPANGILIDAETAVRVQSQIISKPLPPMELKGHAQPLQIYQVLGEQTAVTQAQARFQQWQQPPVGREKELKQLFAKTTSALNGEGGLVAIHGAYGSGQMPFLAAGVRRWLEAGGQALVGVCQQHTSDVAYAPWVSVWRDFFETSPDMPVSVQIERVSQRVNQLTPEVKNGIALWRELLGAPLRVTAMLVDLPILVRQMRLFKLVKRSLTAAVAERPLLIVIEDIHLADQASLDLLDALVQHSVDLPLLFLVTYRSGADFNFQVAAQLGSSQIALGDFTPRQARQLIQQRLGSSQLPLAVEQRLGLRDRQGRESAVNPLFLEETLQLLADQNVVTVDKGKYADGRIRIDEAKLAQMQVPDSVSALFLSRLDRLPAAERSLLQTASVIGREFDLATLVAISPGLDRETAAKTLATLVEADLVQQLSGGLIATYLFQHNLVHQVVYQSLAYARRQTLHATIADLIVRQSGELLPTRYPLLAYHFGQTERYQDGLKYALAAAEQAEQEHNHRGAAEFYKQALSHLGALGKAAGWETAVSVIISRAKALLRLGQFSKADQLANEAMQLCQTQEAKVYIITLNNLLAEIRLRQTRFNDVLTFTEKVVQAAPRQTPPDQLAQAYLLWGRSLAGLNDWPAAVEKLMRARKIYLDIAQTTGLAAVQLALAEVNCQQFRLEEALQALREAAAFLNDEACPTLLGWLNLVQSQAQLRLGRAGLALAAIETAVPHLRSAGSNALAHGLTQRAKVQIYKGEFTAALADLKMAESLFNGMDDVPGQLGLNLLWGVDYHGGLGEWLEAQRRLIRVSQLLAAQPKEEGMVVPEVFRLWLGLGYVALKKGRWSKARSSLEKMLKAVSSERLVWWQPAACYAWGMLLLAEAEATERQTAVAEAHHFFEKGLDAVQAGGCPDELPLLLLQLGLTAQEMGDERCWHYLETAVHAAQQRARFADKQFVLREAGQLLKKAPDTHLRKVGAESLARVL